MWSGGILTITVRNNATASSTPVTIAVLWPSAPEPKIGGVSPADPHP